MKAKPQDVITKVVFVNRFFYPDLSATSQILTDLAWDLAASGVQVQVVSSRLRYEDPHCRLPPDEVVRGVRVSRIWTTRFGRANLVGRALDYLTFYAAAAWKVWQCTDRNTVLIIKTDPPLLSLALVPVARLRGATVVNWLQDIFPEVAAALQVKLAKGLLLRVMRAARNASLRAARMNVVLGSRGANMLEGEGIPRSQVRVIANWADGTEIQPIPREVNPLRAEWGLTDRFVVGYSGNLGRAHEFMTFLDAATALRERVDITFLFIGGGAQVAEVEAVARKRELNNVMFRPYQPRERLRQSLAVADVHLVSLNPLLEGLIVPSKFYGILAAGRPAIFVGDPDGEIARVTRQINCGYSVAAGDADGLARMIGRLANDAQLCASLGGNGRQALITLFDRPVAVQAWKDLIAEARAPAPTLSSC